MMRPAALRALRLTKIPLAPWPSFPECSDVLIRTSRKQFFSTTRTPLNAEATSIPATSKATNPSTLPPQSRSSPPQPQKPQPPPINIQEEDPSHIDWSTSFHGLSVEPFSKDAADILLAPIAPTDIEVKPDGIVYLPEIKYRRILNRAFGPGGWGLAPRGETIVTDKAVTREYALLAHGRLVSIARGEQDYFNKEGIPTASEGCKSNALMRCCKDLGVASELWDPRFIRKFRSEYTREVFVEHAISKKRTKIWLRKEDPVSYPFKETR